MSYKRKMLTIGSTVMLITGIVTLIQLDAQKVEARAEVIATNSVEQQEKLIDKTVKEIANDLDSSSLPNEGEVKAASSKEEKSTTSDDSNKKDASDDTTQDGQDNSGDTKQNLDNDTAVTPKPEKPTLKTGWDGKSYYKKDGNKAVSEWLEVEVKENEDVNEDENVKNTEEAEVNELAKDKKSWYYFDENGQYVIDTWKGSYYLKANGQMAHAEWVQSPETGWHFFNPDGTYVQNQWVGAYYIKQWGYMASNEWIWDKDYQNWFFINEDGSYARYTWKGSYFLTQWGEMAKSRWAWSPETGWHYFNEDGTYVQNCWVGAYYIKQWGYMASDEWVWDPDYSNWFYIAEDGHYVRNAWIGNYYLTQWGEMAKNEVEEGFSNWIYTANNRYFYDNKGNKIGDGTAKKVIDVSEWQGEIDWENVMKHNDIDAVIVRIGYGSIGIDKHAKETIKQLNDLQIPYGIYLYSYASDAEDGKAEAEHTIKLLKKFNAKPTYPIYFDVEDWVIGKAHAPTDTKTWVEIVNTYLDTMHKAGYQNVDVYSYRHLLQTRLNHPDILKHVTWVAAYTDELGWENPHYDGPLGWQYTSSAKMTGLGDELGHTDVSVWYE